MEFHLLSGHSRNTVRQMGINEADPRKHVGDAKFPRSARCDATRTDELQVVRFNFFAAAAVFSVYADCFYAMCNKIDTFMPLPGKIRVGISLRAAQRHVVSTRPRRTQSAANNNCDKLCQLRKAHVRDLKFIRTTV